MNKIIFITGGARSGKSSFAEKLAEEIYNNSNKKQKIAYIATGIAFDREFKKRISNHKKKRSKIFETYEEDIYIDKKIEKIFNKHRIFLVECLTTWLGNIYQKKAFDVEKKTNIIIDNIINLFIRNKDKNDSSNIIKSLIKNKKDKFFNSVKNLLKIKSIEKIIIIISNEIGMGIVPDNKLSRDFRDLLGIINQKIAKNADFVYFICSGIPTRIK